MRLASRLSTFFLSVLFILSFVSGCASTGGMKNVSKESLLKKTPNQSLVLGRLIVKDRGTFWESGGSGKSTLIKSVTMYFTKAPGGDQERKGFFHEIDADGYFGLIMEPGEYRLISISGEITQVLLFIPGNSWSFLVPTNVSFVVPSGESVYIGSLLFEFKIKDKWTKDDIEYQMTALDEFHEDMRVFREKYLFLPQQVLNASKKTSTINKFNEKNLQ